MNAWIGLDSCAVLLFFLSGISIGMAMKMGMGIGIEGFWEWKVGEYLGK